jgi:hypothetical protein
VTNSDVWVPLGQRSGGIPLNESLTPGVPGYLLAPLRRWVARQLEHIDAPTLRETVNLHLHLNLPVPNAFGAVFNRSGPSGDYLPAGEPLLDITDAVLRWGKASHRASAWEDIAADLEQVLRTARSEWRVNATRSGLERRVACAATVVAAAVIRSAPDEASGHLLAGWAAAYGRSPDPDRAYDEAILAIEAIACPLVSPRNSRATLGTVLSDLRNQEARWELTVGDPAGVATGIAALTAMMTLLWTGQSRHAGGTNSRRQTQTEGEAAIHMATAIIQWLTAGVLRRKP